MQHIFPSDEEYIGKCRITDDHNYAIDPSGLLAAVPQPAVVSDELGAFVDIEDVSCNTTVVTQGEDHNTASADESEDEYEGSVTRCICDFQHDDGFMICCDQCSVWQHIACMGVNRNNIPETYLCELCSPRPVDKRRAIRLQLLKREQLEGMDSSATDSGTEDVLSSQMLSGPVHHTMSRDDRQPRQYKAKAMVSDGDWLAERNAHQNKLRSGANARPSVRGRRRGFLLDSCQNVTIDHSQADVINNTYTDALVACIAAGMQSGGGFPLQSVPFVNAALFKEQLSRQRFRITQTEPRTIEAAENLRINQPVAEYTGRVMLREEFEAMQPASYFSFVLFYAGLPGVVICVDASASDNQARYIRYSCTPNTKNFEPQAAGHGIHAPGGFLTKPRKRKHRKTEVNPYNAAAFHYNFSDDDDFQL